MIVLSEGSKAYILKINLVGQQPRNKSGNPDIIRRLYKNSHPLSTSLERI